MSGGTAMAHAADADTMRLGGWRDLKSLKRCYEHATQERMVAALESRREVRHVAH